MRGGYCHPPPTNNYGQNHEYIRYVSTVIIVAIANCIILNMYVCLTFIRYDGKYTV